LWSRFRIKSALEALGLTWSRSGTEVRGDLGAGTVEFLVASIRRIRRRTRRIWTGVAAVVVVLLVLTTVASFQWRNAVGQQRLATARALVALAEQRRGQDIREALRLNLAADRIVSTPETRASLAATLSGTTLAATIPNMWANALAFSPDGQTMATTNRRGPADGTLQLWDVTDQHTAVLIAVASDDQDVTGAAFSRDTRTLATTTAADGAGTVQLWDVTNRRNPVRVATARDDQEITAVAFSPDGRTLATTTRGNGSPGGSVQLWRVTDRHDLVHTAVAPYDAGTAVAFGPDGHTVVTASDSQTGSVVQLWEVTGRGDLTRAARLPGRLGSAMALSADGRILATAGSVRTHGAVQLWDVTDRRNPVPAGTLLEG